MFILPGIEEQNFTAVQVRFQGDVTIHQSLFPFSGKDGQMPKWTLTYKEGREFPFLLHF